MSKHLKKNLNNTGKTRCVRDVTSLVVLTKTWGDFPYFTGSCSKFEFPSRVNHCGPSLYWTGLAGATRLTRSDFMLDIGSIYFY